MEFLSATDFVGVPSIRTLQLIETEVTKDRDPQRGVVGTMTDTVVTPREEETGVVPVLTSSSKSYT